MEEAAALVAEVAVVAEACVGDFLGDDGGGGARRGARPVAAQQVHLVRHIYPNFSPLSYPQLCATMWIALFTCVVFVASDV